LRGGTWIVERLGHLGVSGSAVATNTYRSRA
jgi:hypothetical protein